MPAAIAQIYGTTSADLPDLHAPDAYAIVFGLMVSICLGLFLRFKKLHWL